MRTVCTLHAAMMTLLAKATDRELARMLSYLREEYSGPGVLTGSARA
jgi:hypothetical protein